MTMETRQDKSTVCLCASCQEQYLEEYGPSLGYTIPVRVRTVPVTNCDNWEIKRGPNKGKLLQEVRNAK